MTKVILITSDSLRHIYFRKILAQVGEVEVIRSYVEKSENRLESHSVFSTAIEKQHDIARKKSESDFFQDLVMILPDISNPFFLPKGDINLDNHIDDIMKLSPDVIVTYGSSIIERPLIEKMKGRFLNIHLGLSPYYRGAATNLHSLANGEFHLCGYTLMHIDEGIDTGEIIHQRRADIDVFDTVHTIGNRLIKHMTTDVAKILSRWDEIQEKKQFIVENSRVFRIKDVNETVLRKLYRSVSPQRITEFLECEHLFVQKFPIIEQSFLGKL